MSTTWQWQLHGTLNTTYDVDLFDTSATQIDALQAYGRLVLCYFSVGSCE